MMSKIKSLLLLPIALCVLAAQGQAPATTSSADIFLQLKKLNVLASVLYVAAHPDDENNGLLPYFAKEKLYRTAYLSLTRGDGGQNLIGSEQGIELGMIRTQELLAARRIDGAEQYFSRAFEFGFSKSADEALSIWDKEKILSDVVWIIRQYQPDVIIKRFPPDKRAGHGHHAASSILADEAFTAAADPKRFPEQFAYGVKPWQAKRLMWNTYNFGSNNTTSNDQLKIEVGGYNPLLGKSYGELGGEARSMHKSQGEGRPRRRGQIVEYFSTLKGEAPETGLMDDVETSWSRISGGSKIEPMVNTIIAQFNFQQPELSVPALVRLYSAIKALPEGNWRNKKLAETQAIIEECSALFAEAVTGQEFAVQGDSLTVNFNFNCRSNIGATVKEIALMSSDGVMQQRLQKIKADSLGSVFYFSAAKANVLDSAVNVSLAQNQNASLDYTYRINDNASLSQPYWLNRAMKPGYFDVPNPLLIGEPESKPNYFAHFIVNISGQDFAVERPLQYKFVDPVRGELYEPVTVIPKVLVSISPTIVLSNVSPPTHPSIYVNYVSNINAARVPVTVTLQNGSGTDVFKDVPVNFKKGVSGSFPVQLKDVYYQGQKKYIEPVLSLQLNGKEELFTYNLRTIHYDHIPYLNYFYRDNVRVIDDEIKTVGHKIAYIVGAGDKVPDALTAMGFDVHFLNENEINDATLRQFDAVVVGIRAYNILDYLSTKNDVFNRYIQNGGNMIVQYMKSNQGTAGPIHAGPYPFAVNSTRVTEENAKVNFLLPDHPAFNYPNKITEKDFAGWVQERSTYQADPAVTDRFEKLIAMNDTGENESNGSLVVAKYGKGNFVYVSLVLFRQLPAAVPGAYRLLANLIALPQNK